MRKDAQATREKILDSANVLVMESGYGGTTVDEVIEKAGVTKGAFFYHFKSKEELARSMVERYAAADRGLLDTIIADVEKKTADPVQQLIMMVQTYIDMLEKDPHPQGCMYASYCYESGLLDETTLKPVRDMVLYWREKVVAKVNAAIQAKPPRIPVDATALADNFLATFEGGFVLARTLKDPPVILRQLEQFRTLIAALFT